MACPATYQPFGVLRMQRKVDSVATVGMREDHRLDVLLPESNRTDAFLLLLQVRALREVLR